MKKYKSMMITLMLLLLAGCGSKDDTVKYKLTFSNSGFESEKTEYAAGEDVTVRYDISATDTDYSFSSDDVDFKQDYDGGYVFTFVMPEHDVALNVESRNSMEYDPYVMSGETPENTDESVTMADDVLPTGTTDAEEAADNKADTKAAAIYFDKGVYQNYPPDDVNASLDYFYVFYDGGAGYTENAATGMGLPFACEQSEGSVRFSFGGEGDGWDVFTVETVENKAVIGHFEDGKRLAFVYVPDADPDNFNAAEYMYGSSHKEE